MGRHHNLCGLLAGASLSAQKWLDMQQHPTSPWPGLDAGALWEGVSSPPGTSLPWCPPQTSAPALSSATLHPSDIAIYIWRCTTSQWLILLLLMHVQRAPKCDHRAKHPSQGASAWLSPFHPPCHHAHYRWVCVLVEASKTNEMKL